MKNQKKIEDFLKTLKTEIDILYFIDISEIDYSNAYTSIYGMIADNGGFDVEIIYYSTAIEFLKNNDPSLRNSLEIASDYGYDTKDLNSEILASILASEMAREEFYNLQNEIDTFFSELN